MATLTNHLLRGKQISLSALGLLCRLRHLGEAFASVNRLHALQKGDPKNFLMSKLESTSGIFTHSQGISVLPELRFSVK